MLSIAHDDSFDDIRDQSQNLHDKDDNIRLSVEKPKILTPPLIRFHQICS